ncbi:2Fe-2S iron-sulfur cluster binding domain-containing protein [Duganella sp. FT80W]|uniref:2Fe-2S iron-sulfur cluster binding domain-containing protein n=1 Tax=Duganella guangzhouensis TaxID=2666084 RepID=A0A6I2L1M1_9BURK|nr:2Fe-2S iron-sulfur cluster-binding protein [Duganella guangzhouensis]MRW91107.1 2Fe-2S iron-sulfur cluster binding domain-containing protein [Duganella guangzhouensis]
MKVTLAGQGWSFDAAPSQTVLQAAEQAGVRLPSSCRNGTCRTCICLSTGGTVRYTVDWPGLSLDEKREGYILPCVALPTSDLLIEAPAASLR